MAKRKTGKREAEKEEKWTFIPTAYTWGDNTAPWVYPTRIDFLDPVNTSGQDFVGVNPGDVNNSWD